MDDKNKEWMDWYEKHGGEHWAHWRAWGSWFSWGSPVGLGLFFIEVGVFLWTLHLAGLLK